MRILLFLLVAPMLGSVSVRAEDFTGFYAGLNAGYAVERGKDRQSGAVAIPGGDADRDLPPSAESASQAMQTAARARSGRSPR